MKLSKRQSEILEILRTGQDTAHFADIDPPYWYLGNTQQRITAVINGLEREGYIRIYYKGTQLAVEVLKNEPIHANTSNS